MATPPNFTLYGDTGGGPPVEYTWRRDGSTFDFRQHSTNIVINRDAGRFTTERLANAFYRFELTITDGPPGVYEYNVNNRAMDSSLSGFVNIEGTYI